jgi:hypothetical protein
MVANGLPKVFDHVNDAQCTEDCVHGHPLLMDNEDGQTAIKTE